MSAIFEHHLPSSILTGPQYPESCHEDEAEDCHQSCLSCLGTFFVLLFSVTCRSITSDLNVGFCSELESTLKRMMIVMVAAF